MNLLTQIGLAVRDGVYELFMEYTRTTDLKELKESGYSVKELTISPDGWDKLYYLEKDKKLHCACSLVIIKKDSKPEPQVKFHTAQETLELLKYFKQQNAARSESLRASTTKGENE